VHTLEGKAVLFALGLSALAGYVDAIGFLELGRYFVSFMSGNSTQLAVGLVAGERPRVLLLAGIIASFVSGAGVGTVVNQRAAKPNQAFAVLLLVTLVLTAAMLCHGSGWPLIAVLLMALAMGAENAVLQSADESLLGVTYMTGTLVKIGQRIALACMGGKKFSWVPYLLLWLGLISGGITGAVMFDLLGLSSLWLAAIWAMLLTAVAWYRRTKRAV